jgi:hypothetical protein
MKTCPYCLADIAEEARKCKFCGEWVDREDRVREAPDSPPARPSSRSAERLLEPDPRFLRKRRRGGWYDFGEKSLTVGFLGLCLCPPFLLVSILFGILALTIHDGNHNQNLGIAGLIVSGSALVIWACVIAFMAFH